RNVLANPPRASLLAIKTDLKNAQQQRRHGRKIQVDIIPLHLCYEPAFAKQLQIALRIRARIPLSRTSESCAYVGNGVDLAAGVVLENGVVVAMQVPIADQSHHDTQTIPLAGSIEGIVPPVPRRGSLLAGTMALQAHVQEIAAILHVVLPPAKAR